MKIKYNKYEILFYSLLIMIMAMSLTMALNNAIGIQITGLNVAQYILLILIPFVILFNYPRQTWKAFLGVIIIVVIYVYKTNFFFPILSYLNKFFEMLIQYLTSKNFFDFDYSKIFSIIFNLIIIPILSFSVFYLGNKTKIILILVGTLTMTYFWFIYADKAKNYLMIYLFASALCYSYQIFKNKEALWQSKNEKSEPKIGMYWAIHSGVLIFIVLLIALFIPINLKPIRSNWLSEKITDVFPFISEWRNDALDSYSYGFSTRYNSKVSGYNEKKLGGPVTLNKNILLKLNTIKLDEALYLKGIVKDVYTSNTWKKSDKSYKNYLASKDIITDSLVGVDGKNLDIKITPINILTSTIFYPYTLRSVDYNKQIFFLDQDGEAYFSKFIRKGTEYTIETSKPNIQIKELIFDKDVTLNKYTQLPENISSRLINLSKQLTLNRASDYEKVKAVEIFLRNNYQYNLEPSTIPANREFVDYFLFEGKEGYCTYFATAMAVLLRASDIPCRYVEGFIANNDSWNGKDYIIRGTSAHAWVEVNFKGVGWVIFEPTPAYQERIYNNEDKVIKRENKEEEIKTVNSDLINIPKIRDKDILQEDEMGVNQIGPVERKSNYSYLLIFVISLIALIFIMIFVDLIKYKKLKSNERLIISLLTLYSLFDIKIHPNETMREFLNRVKWLNLDLQINDNLIHLIEKFNYSYLGLNLKETKELQNYVRYITDLSIRKKGRIRYYISHIFLTKRYCKNIFKVL